MSSPTKSAARHCGTGVPKRYISGAARRVPTSDPTEEMRNELRRLNGQITDLAPAILAAPSERDIQMDLSSSQAEALSCHFKATEYDGCLWIFAQNTDLGPGAEYLGQFDPIDPRAGHAVIAVEGLAAGTQILRVEDVGYTLLTAGDGFFEDDFSTLGEHIYMVVPEPGSIVLLSLAAFAWPRRRRG